MSELESAVPKWVQLRNLYAARIASGELPPGAHLPTIARLASLHGVSEGTAARAVRHLATEGLVETAFRAGTVVAEPRGGREVLAARLLLSPQQRWGRGFLPGEAVECRASEMVDAPGYVVPVLGLTEVPRHGVAPVWRREQVTRNLAGDPVRLEVSWFDPHWVEVFPELASREAVPPLGGVAWLIGQETAKDPEAGPVRSGWGGCEARPAKADGRELPLLRLGPGTVVLGAVYTWLTVRGLTIEYGEYVVPQGRVIESTWEVGKPPAAAVR